METGTAIVVVGVLVVAAVVLFAVMRQPQQRSGLESLGTGGLLGAGIGALIEDVVVASTAGGSTTQQARTS